jgi:hypothetical protein
VCSGASKLDGKEAEIKLLLQKKVSKASIARIVEVSPMTLDHFNAWCELTIAG